VTEEFPKELLGFGCFNDDLTWIKQTVDYEIFVTWLLGLLKLGSSKLLIMKNVFCCHKIVACFLILGVFSLQFLRNSREIQMHTFK
jgi:hypothetical protein